METLAGPADSALDEVLRTDTQEDLLSGADDEVQQESLAASVRKLDIAERIGRALMQTGEPAPNGGDPLQDDDVVIGMVPDRLRHLHNLISIELAEEVREAEKELNARVARIETTKQLFFDSLKQHVRQPEDAIGMSIRDDWSVVPMTESDDDRRTLHMLDLGSLGDLLNRR
jgi:hypothetical protein